MREKLDAVAMPSPSGVARMGRLAGFALILLPVFGYLLLVVRLSVNVPIMDDYETVLSFLVASDTSPLRWLAQHREHRPVCLRVVASACLRLCGQVDFRDLIYVGTAALLGYLLVLFRVFRERRHPLALFAPVAFLLLGPAGWENMLWATGALQTYAAALFALLALRFWDRRTAVGDVGAMVCGTLATYASANGLLIFYLLLLWESSVCIANLRSAKPATKLLHRWVPLRLPILLAFTVSLTCFYFLGYQHPVEHPLVTASLRHPGQLLRFIATLFGSWAEVVARPAAPWLGAVEAAVLVWLTLGRYDRKNPIVYYLLLFAAGTLTLAALGRAELGIDYAFTSRYKLYVATMLVTIYLAAIDSYPRFRPRRVGFAGLLLASMGLSLASLPPALEQATARIDDWSSPFRATPRGEARPSRLDPQPAAILDKAVKRGIYRPPGK